MPKSVGGAAAAARVEPMAAVGPYQSRVKGMRRRISGATMALWLLLGLAIFGMGAVFYQYRVEIVRGWPQTASLYQLIGIEVNSAGINFRNITYDITSEDGMSVLTVTGEMVNITDQDLPIPRVQVTLRDAGGEELYHWPVALSETRLDVDVTLEFSTQLSSPPLGMQGIEVHFAEDQE